MLSSTLGSNAREDTTNRIAYNTSILKEEIKQPSEKQLDASSIVNGGKHDGDDKLVLKITAEVKEIIVEHSPHDESKSWPDGDLITTIDLNSDLGKRPRTLSIDACTKKQAALSRSKPFMSGLSTRLTDLIQLCKPKFQSKDSTDCDERAVIEYEAVSFMSIFVLLYFVLFLSLSIVIIGCWLKFYRPDIARHDGVSPFWAGAFLATSAFVNCGMSLIDANMIPFQRE